MASIERRLVLAFILLLAVNPNAYGQLRPQVTPAPPKKAPEKKKPAQIVVETSPQAQVYLDDVFKGQASPEGRLVIDKPEPGPHALRVSLAGRKQFDRQVTVVPGKVAQVRAQLGEVEKPSPAPGKVSENTKDGLNYVWIPPGTFQMGCSPGDNECSNDEKPAHQVTISKGFWIGQTEVTAAAYKRFASSSGRQMPSEPGFNSGWANDNMPVVNVTWDDARAFCLRAGGRLPTEAEWEYAARAGSTEARYGPLDEVAWYDQNSRVKAHEVGQKPANAWGLFDTLGNVWEWVSDWYEGNYYQNSPASDPQGPATGTLRVLRGGSWSLFARNARVSDRARFDPGVRDGSYGMRCVRELSAP